VHGDAWGHGSREAAIEEGAAVTFLLVLRGGRFAGGVEQVHSVRESFGTASESSVERDAGPPPAGAIKQGTPGDSDAEHLFQTDCLGAELNFVARIGLGFSALVLDGKRPPGGRTAGEFDAVRSSRRDLLELDDIGLAGESEAKGLDVYAPGDEHTGPALGAAGVDTLVEDAALGGEAVLVPLLLDMNEAPLPLAELQVLQSGKRQEVVWRVQGHPNRPDSLPFSKGRTPAI